jgi:DNA-binding transcriptional ArsR family regulator
MLKVLLLQGEATVNEIAKPFDISLPAVSRHLKVLQTAGLISRGREASSSSWHNQSVRQNVSPIRKTSMA